MANKRGKTKKPKQNKGKKGGATSTESMGAPIPVKNKKGK